MHRRRPVPRHSRREAIVPGVSVYRCPSCGVVERHHSMHAGLCAYGALVCSRLPCLLRAGVWAPCAVSVRLDDVRSVRLAAGIVVVGAAPLQPL